MPGLNLLICEDSFIPHMIYTFRGTLGVNIPVPDNITNTSMIYFGDSFSTR